MKLVCAFVMLVFFQLLISSLTPAARPTLDVKVVSYKSSSQKGVMENNEVNVSLGLGEESKAIIPANSKLSYGHDDNSRKVKGFPSPITAGKMVRKVEENSTTIQPLGHSPGIGHNNPPGAMDLSP